MELPAWIPAVVVWLVIGGSVATMLARRGQPTSTSLAAIPCWPLLLPLLHTLPTDRVESLLATLRPLGDTVDLPRMTAAVREADRRIRAVDEVLDELQHDPRLALEVERLRTARDIALHELDEVGAEAGRIRIQLALQGLGRPDDAMRGRLSELQARVAVLEEVTSVLVS